MRYFSILLTLLTILFLSSCMQKKPSVVKVKIIQTSDVHGAIFPYNFVYDNPAATSQAQAYTYIKQQRADSSQHVILLDNGDILQGQPVVYYYNFVRTDTAHICSQVMNYMQYDAATVGNHDIEPGHAVYDRLAKEFKFPWLAANAVNNNDSTPYFKPYTIIEKQGIRIAVLGLVTPAIPDWLPERIWEGMHYTDMIETARKWVDYIEKNEQPDLLIGMFHAGVDYTYNNQDAETYKNENASILVAQQVPGFDILLVGHDHRPYEGYVVNNQGDSVLVLDPMNAVKKLAVADVVFTLDEKTDTYTHQLSGSLLDVEPYEADPDFMAYFTPQVEEVKKYITRRIGSFTETIDSKGAFFGDDKFIDLINRIQFELTGADISIAAPLSFSAKIEKGDVFVRDMFKLYRYENLLYTMRLSGEEVKGFLEFSYGQWFNQMKDENDHLMAYKKDADGKYVMSAQHKNQYETKTAFFNYDSADGIKYTVDVSKPEGERIQIQSMLSGEAFEPRKMYTVAVNSYRGNGGGGHLIRGANIPKDSINTRILTSTEYDLRLMMMQWIEKQDSITPTVNNNWKVIPEKWAAKGAEKDAKMLFGE